MGVSVIMTSWSPSPPVIVKKPPARRYYVGFRIAGNAECQYYGNSHKSMKEARKSLHNLLIRNLLISEEFKINEDTMEYMIDLVDVDGKTVLQEVILVTVVRILPASGKERM